MHSTTPLVMATLTCLGAAACGFNEYPDQEPGTDAATDTFPDGTADVLVDGTIDHVVDTMAEPWIDTAVDSWADTGVDPWTDTGVDPWTDTAVDTGTDTSSCSEAPCGLVPQCGCPPGFKCSILGDGERACVTAGTGTRGTTCVSDDDCAAGFVCISLFSVEGNDMGACYPYCESAAGCPGDGSVCWEVESTADAWVCTMGCNLVSNEWCPLGSKCYVLKMADPYDEYATDCTADAGYGTQGDACTADSQCGPGYFCGADSGIDECIGYCTITPIDSCSFGCQQFVDEYGGPLDLSFDGFSYGYCYGG
jgi:hypothetical protein